MISLPIRYKTVLVDGLTLFFREAGNRRKKAILLLNGLPNSSSAFQELMYDLKGDYYLVAPDFPGFGGSESPSRDEYEYSFENISRTIEKFMEAIGLCKPSVYAMGYGGAIAFRIAIRKPDAFHTFILQNANAYEESEKTAELVKSLLGEEHSQHRLFADHTSNIAQYPLWQRWLRNTQPKMLLVWGKNSALFSTAAAEAFKNDVPGTRLYVYDASHMALEKHHEDIAGNIRYFLG